MGADTHGKPFYTAQNCAKCGGPGIIKGGPTDSRDDSLCTCNTTQSVTQGNKIMSFDDACEVVAKKYGLGTKLVTGHRQNYFKEAAELYAESKAHEAWVRACEAQRQICADSASARLVPKTHEHVCGSDTSVFAFVEKESIVNAPNPEYKSWDHHQK